MEGKITIKGKVRLQVFDGEKLLQDTGWMDNLITNAGKAAAAGLVGNTGSITAFSYTAVGSDSTAAAASQTALVSEFSTIGLSRASATVSRTTTSVTNDTLRFSKTFTVTGSGTVEEVGVFNASSGGTMLGRKVTGAIPVVNGNSLVTTYDFVFA